MRKLWSVQRQENMSAGRIKKITFIRSRRRRKTISARFKDNCLEVRIPFWVSNKRAQQEANKFLKSFKTKKGRRQSDEFLQKRAEKLNQKYLDGKVKNFTINWSIRQKTIFGICDHKKRQIRISSRLQKAPLWVIDYLILHELAHLLQSNHSKKFWQLVNRYSKTERARGFLQGWHTSTSISADDVK